MSRPSGQLFTNQRATSSFYEDLRTRQDGQHETNDGTASHLDEDNLRQDFHDVFPTGLDIADSQVTTGSHRSRRLVADPSQSQGGQRLPSSRWLHHEEDLDNDVPASLLVEDEDDIRPESKVAQAKALPGSMAERAPMLGRARPKAAPPPSGPRRVHRGDDSHPRRVTAGAIQGGPREKALWRWVNTSNLDSFMSDVYNYFEGGGLWCILCSNALWLLETLFVAVLFTFLTQCVDYRQIPTSHSLNQVIIPRCTSKMSTTWNIALWLYSFFFIWKSIQYFFEIRRLVHIRDFYVHLLEIPDQDMQTVSWQDIVARIMNLRDQNPKTAANVPSRLRRYMGGQSKERLDAHDIANRLMRKDNYLVAMINKDVLDLSLPLPLFRGKQIFSKSMEWYLHFSILDMVFNEMGQVQQDFLKADRRGILSQKLRQRFIFAGLMNLLLAPVILAYVIIVYFFTYYNEYQKDPKLAAARKYTSLAEWKFREFNELPHIFYERLHMSFPFATRYLDQFPKRITEDMARSVAFVSGALTAVLAVGTILDSELFLNFEITKDRSVLFYLGIFGSIWAISRGMVSEETLVFNPEYALSNVIDYTHYYPDHWRGRLHSAEVKREFSELYKMKVVIFLEEVMGIITTPLLLLFSLPKCSDQIVDFFREFTIHVDGLGYICSFAQFDFKKGGDHGASHDVDQGFREGYYSAKHGKLTASYYGFIDNYVVNPKTGIPGHTPPGTRPNFHPPPTFPGLGSTSFTAGMPSSPVGRTEFGRDRGRSLAADVGSLRGIKAGPRDMPPPSPMASVLLDPRHQPGSQIFGPRTSQQSRQRNRGLKNEPKIFEETLEEGLNGVQANGSIETSELDEEAGGLLGESVWQTSPSKGLSRENSAANAAEPEAGVLGLIYQLRQTQHSRRGGGVI